MIRGRTIQLICLKGGKSAIWVYKALVYQCNCVYSERCTGTTILIKEKEITLLTQRVILEWNLSISQVQVALAHKSC